MTASARPVLKIRLQILCGSEIAMGPGKADLLEAIAREGSISAAGRALGMSYRRCWMLVDVMNRCWNAPLVATNTGGTRGGGAHVTETGREVLKLYRSLQKTVEGAAAPEWRALQALLSPESAA
ncbi:MAG: LysR family transcriptional regulator [Sphingobium sp.]|jgi:molybdate transport system regulatory protein|nr:LysR family transcriptional regulator [Sphingobium sp.]MCI1270347.1 LysR family transcriptional regulator [Sphingobium sp.]MCI1755494.1 LysR family transcriptional regulator [Sphingobium sp.]MCI2052128.1 LysR family transcriptional regulator [Sphingobium sp.]